MTAEISRRRLGSRIRRLLSGTRLLLGRICWFVGRTVGVQLRGEAADELRPVDGGALRRGFYAIRPSGLSSDDYSFTYKAGTYTVSKADQAISFAELGDKTYGDADFDLVATGGGRVIRSRSRRPGSARSCRARRRI